MKPIFKPIILLKSALSHVGGAEKYTWRLSKAFQAIGSSVTILTTQYEKPLSDDYKIINCPKTSILSFRQLQAFDRFCSDYVSKHKEHIVFGMDRNRFQTHLRASNGVHAAYLEKRKKNEGGLKKISFSINPLHRTLLKIEKESFEHPDLKKLYANSHMVKDEILHFYNIDPSKIEVIHNGVEWEEKENAFQNGLVRSEIIKQFNLPSSTYHFLFIGNNYSRKGLHLLLEALSLTNKDFHLSILGKDKALPHFKAMAKRLNLEKKTRFFGPCPDPIPFYQMADCLVIPSFYDPFANVTLEALAMGLFVVSSGFNGGHEVLTPTSGVKIENLFHIDSFAQALETALTHPKSVSSSQNIRKSVQHLDFSHQLKILTDSVFSS